MECESVFSDSPRIDDSVRVYECTSPFLAADRRCTHGSRRFSLRIDDSDRVHSWTSPFLASGSTTPNGFQDSPMFKFHFFALVSGNFIFDVNALRRFSHFGGVTTHFGGWTIPFEFTYGTSPFRSTIPIRRNISADGRFRSSLLMVLHRFATRRFRSSLLMHFAGSCHGRFSLHDGNAWSVIPMEVAVSRKRIDDSDRVYVYSCTSPFLDDAERFS